MRFVLPNLFDNEFLGVVRIRSDEHCSEYQTIVTGNIYPNDAVSYLRDVLHVRDRNVLCIPEPLQHLNIEHLNIPY